MQRPKQPIDGFIYSILNGNAPSWPDTAIDTFADELEQALHLHGLYPLIYHLYKDVPAWTTWPGEIRARLKRTSLHHAAHDLAAESKTRDLLTKLQASGIRPIVLKGTAIAYTHYSEKSTRTRGDIDLLFQRSELSRAFRIMEAQGYEYVYRQGFLGQELGYVDVSAGPTNLPLDIHWRSSSYVLMAHILNTEEIIRSAVTIPDLAPLPCAMNPVHALMHACMHWVKHLASGDSIRILWVYDIYLLAKQLSATEIRQFISGVTEKRISRICLAALSYVEQKLHCRNLVKLIRNLETIKQKEATARMLGPNARSFVAGDVFSSADISFLPRVLEDILFPPGAYLLRLYGKQQPMWLPLLYTHRLSAGLLEYVRRRSGQ